MAALPTLADMPHAVLIVEDDPRLLHAFADAVRSADDLCLVGAASDVPDGLRMLSKLKPDVLLVDIGLPSGSGIELIRHVQAHLPHCEAMVITAFADEQAVLSCIEAGATGYLLKDSGDANIVQQIRLLCAGGSPISPAIARCLLTRVSGKAEARTGESTEHVALSAQEVSVLTMCAKGYTYQEIAHLMGLSFHTVQTYIKRIYRKLQVHSKTEAIFEARKLGLMRE
jgi:DNA-binding NarL/FixJ family response regulator